MQKQTLQKVLAAAMSVAVLGTCAAVTSFATSEDDSDDGNRHVIDLDIDDIEVTYDGSSYSASDNTTETVSTISTAKSGDETPSSATIYVSDQPGIAFTTSDISLDIGTTTQLNLLYVTNSAGGEDPVDITKAELTSSDEKVATVDKNGAVTAISSGNAVITAKVGEATATCNVKVTSPDALTFSLSSAAAKAGEEVTVELTCSNNPGIAAFQYELVYDSGSLELVSCDPDGVFGSINTSPVDEYPYTIEWSKGVSNSNATGKVATFTFKVNEDAADGDYTISLVGNEKLTYSVDSDNPGVFTPVEFRTVAGTITVGDVVTTTTTEPPTTTVEPPTTTQKPSTTVKPTATGTTGSSTTGDVATKSEIKGGTNTTSTNTSAVQTGAVAPTVVIFLVLASAVVGMVIYRKKFK